MRDKSEKTLEANAILDWSLFLATHERALLLLARQWSQTLADAEEAVQEGFLRFWRSRPFDGDPVPRLFSSVKWAAMDQARKRTRRQTREKKACEFDCGSSSAFEDLPIERRERQAQIEIAMRELAVSQREVLVMKIWGDMTFDHIAQALNIPRNTAASRYRYALQTLRRHLRPVKESL